MFSGSMANMSSTFQARGRKAKLLGLSGSRMVCPVRSPSIDRASKEHQGRLLAIAYEDCSITLVNSHTGKIVFQIECSKHSRSPIRCLGWGINFIEPRAIRERLEKSGGENSLDDVIQQGLHNFASDAPLDLPADLAFLSVEGILPKLSLLPTGGKE